MLKSFAMASLVIVVTNVAALAQEGDDTGQIAFNTYCRQCHSVRKGDNRLGPSLHSIFGAKAGQVTGYPNYSGSLQESITWDEASWISSSPMPRLSHRIQI